MNSKYTAIIIAVLTGLGFAVDIEPTWDSMAAHTKVPESVKDGKVGMWMHRVIPPAASGSRPNEASHFGYTEQPNVVIIFADDLGYGDLSCYGSQTIKTPHIDRMAKEGLRLTNFYAQTVCGPSRAALMTGCYPLRVATESNRVEIHPHLHTNEITIAEVLKEVGYTSAAFGKWDLAGHSQTNYSPSLLPTHQGFDYFFGTPTSNDSFVNLLRNEEIVERKVDMSQLTRRYTDEAIAFIKRSKDRPFFVYLAHTMPHVRLAVSEPFKGKSAGGLYGDVVEEIDWNVGRLLQTLKDEGLDQKTYVIFTSDNGPWYFGRSPGHKRWMGNDWAQHGGSAGPLRGAKTSPWEGGLRVPFIVRAPGKVPAGRQSDVVTSTLDMLPTLARLAGGRVPIDRVIDGRDITALFAEADDATLPEKPFYFYVRTRLDAVRLGKWKLHLPRPVDTAWEIYSTSADAIAVEKPMLFDVENDRGETEDRAAQHPDVVAELMKYIEQARDDIGDFDRIGKGARFFDKQTKRPDIAAYEKQTTSNRKPDRAGALSVPPSPKGTEQSAINFESFLKQHDMVWDRVPNRWEVAPYTGNGNVGFLFYQAQGEANNVISIYAGRHDYYLQSFLTINDPEKESFY